MYVIMLNVIFNVLLIDIIFKKQVKYKVSVFFYVRVALWEKLPQRFAY